MLIINTSEHSAYYFFLDYNKNSTSFSVSPIIYKNSFLQTNNSWLQPSQLDFFYITAHYDKNSSREKQNKKYLSRGIFFTDIDHQKISLFLYTRVLLVYSLLVYSYILVLHGVIFFRVNAILFFWFNAYSTNKQTISFLNHE